MPINTKASYIELGTGVNADGTLANSFSLPAPNSLGASNEYLVEAERNANGMMIIQQVGRTQYVSNFSWSKLRNTVWWGINRWLDANGMVFYIKQLEHTTGKVTISKFYRGNVGKASPSTVTEIKSGVLVPAYYLNCSINFIDMGEDNVTVVQEVSL